MKENNQLISRILQSYGISHTTIGPPQKGYRNTSYAIDGKLNVIVYKNEPHILSRIKAANAVGDFAAAHGLPARHTVDPRIITLCSPQSQRYGAIYNYLPGATIPWEAYTMAHLKLLGKTLGKLHGILQKHLGSTPSAATENLHINRRINSYFADLNVSRALRSKLGITVLRSNHHQLLTFCTTLPNQQTLHMDFVRGNILFAQNRGEGGLSGARVILAESANQSVSRPKLSNILAITGILDFEKTAHGHPAFDIARTLAFLLVDCTYKTEPQIRKYFLHSGYAKRGGQPLPPAQLLERLVDFFLLYDFYKFLRHNPYQSLPQNHHFVRTARILQKRGIIVIE